MIGCGPSELPFTDNSKDSEAFAKDIKELVLTAADRLKNSSQPADSIRQVVLSLSDLKKCPTGSYLPIYEELHKLTSDLLQEAENGKPKDLKGKLAKIAEVANKLPGAVKVEKELSKD